jgi:hypothetical protein
MTTTTRQNNLILNEDWKRIYQTFKNADFKSYDFENLRRVIITYLRENYPEDFNDYIESSEYMAIIDAVAFLGQSLAFRIDLASRENFLELAERRESVLRIARMLSYNPKRNKSSNGLLKFTTVTTTEEILDSNGKNLSQQIVSWNDPTNPNWAEQFILILNSAMADNTEFGRSQGSAVIQGISTDQYRFRTNSQDVPIYAFSKSVAGRTMTFEVVSTAFKDKEEIYEEAPSPGNQLGFVYRNDGRGPASVNTGFYMLFKQGSLELADFSIDVPTTNERISVDSPNINNDDIWLFSLSANGQQQDQWLQVSSLVGNNIAYNSITRNIKNIYAVTTRENDRVDLVFADGVYGSLPQGAFRVYYRVSNGLRYKISPTEMRGINLTIPYINKRGVQHTLTVGLSLQYTVANSAAAEDLETVRANAPALYYTQNRMVTGEDYNLAPLTSSQEIIKIKSINRTSSGISRNFEIIDASGKYSSVNVFADDGYIYREENEKILNFKFTNRIDIINFLKKRFEPALSSTGVYNFYLVNSRPILFAEQDTLWDAKTSEVNLSTGNFENANGDPRLIGPFSQGSLRSAVPGALVKFVPPPADDEFPLGYAFKKDKIIGLTMSTLRDPELTFKVWSKIIRVVGDGTQDVLSNGQGPVSFNDQIPTSPGLHPIIERIIPKFVFDIPPALESEIANQIFLNRNFGLSYDNVESKWRIISASNLDLVSSYSLDRQGDTSNNNLDASWIASFVKDVDQYIVTVRNLDYVFGSKEQNRFYFDANERAYNEKTGLVGKDQIKVLGINTEINSAANLGRDIKFEIDDTVKFEDGYESSVDVKVAFFDRDSDGVIDDPESFVDIAGEDSVVNYIFFKEVTAIDGSKEFKITDDVQFVLLRESLVNIDDYQEGDLIYFYDENENRVKRKVANELQLATEYKGFKGRRDIKFQYIHNASVDRRIDPSVSNIIDIFLLTKTYDEEYRQFLRGAIAKEPEAPSSEDLRIRFGSKLGEIKVISDDIIFHPVRYKVLFGQTADEKLRAQFKVVKNPNRAINDNDLKVRIVDAIDEFFSVNNWDFGDKFYLSELTTFIQNSIAPDVSNIVIIPRQPTQVFGSLFEIQSGPNEIFVSGATVDDVEIVSEISASEVRADPDRIVNRT